MSILDVEKLNKLIAEFKTSNNRLLLNAIFKQLDFTLQQKAKYVYFVQKFVKAKFAVEEYNERTQEMESKEKLSYFKLQDVSDLELNDILHRN